MARRREEEFHCQKSNGGCDRYFLTWLRSDFFGNYTIICPGCGHPHFRVIKEGLITEDRHQKVLGQSEQILSMASTLRDQPYHDDPEFRRRQVRDYSMQYGGEE